jgi:hypothetical protein
VLREQPNNNSIFADISSSHGDQASSTRGQLSNSSVFAY